MKVLKADPETRTADGAPVMRWVPAPREIPAYPGSVIRRGQVNDLTSRDREAGE